MERTPNPDLTRCELAIAQLVATGRTNEEVADVLDRSVNTVKTHLRHVYQKLGVRNRTELVPALAIYQERLMHPPVPVVPWVGGSSTPGIYTYTYTTNTGGLIENTPV
jgi:DNA-binding CsgD family transcriptional regulator